MNTLTMQVRRHNTADCRVVYYIVVSLVCLIEFLRVSQLDYGIDYLHGIGN